MKQVLLILVSVLFFSCGQSKLSKELGCEKTSFSNLETVEDVHKNFSVKLPDNWKTNLYFDNSQSSIYSADTTKQLIETYLVDITMISSKIDFDNPFILDYKNQLTKNNLVEVPNAHQCTDPLSFFHLSLGNIFRQYSIPKKLRQFLLCSLFSQYWLKGVFASEAGNFGASACF